MVKIVLKYLFFNAFCKSVLKFLEQIFILGPQSLRFLFINEAKSNQCFAGVVGEDLQLSFPSDKPMWIH